MNRQLHKFGGSSLANIKCYQQVVKIMAKYSQPGDLIVVSAAGSTTNQLVNWLTLSKSDQLSAYKIQQSLCRYQSELINGLLQPSAAEGLLTALSCDFERLLAMLDGYITDSVYAEVVGHGEIWSARLMSALLNQQDMAAKWLDSREFLCAERAIQPKIDVNSSLPLLQQLLIHHSFKRLVITGFICRNQVGETVLLGRNGSDYSATQIGVLAGASRVTIWSNVAGVYSADPHKVKDACLLPLLRLDEANELARLAAPVLHARALQPISDSDIDLLLRCSYQPDKGSTRIERVLSLGTGAKIVTSNNNVCLIELSILPQYDFNMAYKKIGLILKCAQVKPLAVGIHSERRLLQLCYTSDIADSVMSTFSIEQTNLPAHLKLRTGIALIALVGSGVAKNKLHSQRFYQQLKYQPIEFFWVAEDDISLVAVLSIRPTKHVIQRLHASVFCTRKRIGLMLFGKGNIGSHWLELFAREQKKLSERTGFEFILSGVIDSKRSLLSYKGLDASQALNFFSNEAMMRKPDDLFLWMRAHPYDDLVVLDVTASISVAKQYQDFASYGFHVISANKLAGSSSSDNYHQTSKAFIKNSCHWLYNATVGAGLPINHTVRDLINSGDSILSISGIFSGTLSWLFTHFDGNVSFTELVTRAWQQGLTEPDPRVDLSGQDVMRKLVILAREAGYEIEPDQVCVESLIAINDEQGPLHQFFNTGSDELNDKMFKKLKKANSMGLLLRYIARFETNGKASVGIEAVHHDHPMASLLPCDNIFAIESCWYRNNPLIIRGPGAGRDVTAGAIQSDLNRLAQLLNMSST